MMENIQIEWVIIREDRIFIAYSHNGAIRVVQPYTIPEPPIVEKPRPVIDLRSIWDWEF